MEESAPPESGQSVMLVAGEPPGSICRTCLAFPFLSLPSEDEGSEPHLPSITALESSAETCVVCKLILDVGRQREELCKSRREDKGDQADPRAILSNSLHRNEDDEYDEYEVRTELPNRWLTPTTNLPVRKLPNNLSEIESEAGELRPWLYGNRYINPETGRFLAIGFGVRFSRHAGPDFEEVEGGKFRTVYMGSFVRYRTNEGMIHLYAGLKA